MDAVPGRAQYHEPDWDEYRNIAGNDTTIADATRLSPYIWTCIDLSFSTVFILLFLALSVVALGARFKALRQFFGVRSYAVLALSLGHLILFAGKWRRDKVQLDRLDWIEPGYAVGSNVIQDGVLDASRLTLLVVLTRTAVNMLRSWLVPRRRGVYEFTAWVFMIPVALALFIGILFKVYILQAEFSLPQWVNSNWPDDHRAHDDLIFESALVYTLAMDATFVLLNGAAFTLILCSVAAHKDRRILACYAIAAISFQLLAIARLVLIPLVMVNGDDLETCVWDHSHGFLKPLTGRDAIYALKTVMLTYDTVIYGVLSAIGIGALVQLGRIQPTSLNNDLDLQPGEYTDDEPYAQPQADDSLIVIEDHEADEPPRYEDSQQRTM